MSQENYKKLSQRGILRTERRPAPHQPALIAYESIPHRFRKVIEAKVGDPYQATRFKSFTDYIKNDAAAMEFYSNYKLQDGRNLPPETITEYSQNASFLNTIGIISKKRSAQRRALGGNGKNIWENIAHVVEQLRDQYGHTLPSNPRRLYDRYRQYKKEGYPALIHKNFCNDNSRKVTGDIENLILSLYVMENKPYAKSTHDLYLQFLGGAVEVIDTKTGEIYNPEDFKDQHGNPVVVSESTIWNVINNPLNRVYVDKVRNDSKYFNDVHRPHHHRVSPFFSLSKVSLDDRDLPRKMNDGTRVKAYYAYDVASTALIGAAYSRKKDTNLFIDCMRDMFRFIEIKGLGQPAEVEVEHHLVNRFSEDLMKAGLIFRFVHWCVPGNSQEKRAEHFNRAKKYGFEKRYQVGIGRFTAQLEANRPKQVGEWNEEGMRIKEQTFTMEELVADDRHSINEYNNAPHPNQKRYPGKTRLQVLLENQNPNLQHIDKAILLRYIGNETVTSIRRSQYVTVQGQKYMLPSPVVLQMLTPNDLNVKAYWLPNDNGITESVYIYQDGQPICECKKLEAYNEAKAEQTPRDLQLIENQREYIKSFTEMAKNGKNGLAKIQVNNPLADVQHYAEPVEATLQENRPDTSFDNDFETDALASL